ncbi:THO1 [Brettanomyces bruxellensis]|uniref:DEBR0S5_01200g1_1 n=1 Tax=Dekkera bruxellensis TaxID=5007 RepID=A0A7D9D2D8_DEKBR|nr:THO1 [Brettanomyces bruxellensis]
MASSYSSSTVVQLKELLKSRGLPMNGVKADLIARLEESDKIDAELDEQEEKEHTDDEKKPETVESAPSTAPVVTAPPQNAATTPIEQAEQKPKESVATPTKPASQEAKPKPVEKKIVSLDQLKDEALNMLKKKIARAERFGSEADVKPLKTMLNRIQKFGVSPDSAIAHELGYKSEAQRKKEEAERKTREYLQKKNGEQNHGHRRHRRRFRPYARERTRS